MSHLLPRYKESYVSLNKSIHPGDTGRELRTEEGPPVSYITITDLIGGDTTLEQGMRPQQMPWHNCRMGFKSGGPSGCNSNVRSLPEMPGADSSPIMLCKGHW